MTFSARDARNADSSAGERHRDIMFRVCGGALITAGVVVGKFLTD